MTSAVDLFTKFLVMECEDAGNTTFTDDLLTKAKAQITAGNGSLGFMASASANGKSFTRNEKLSADEVAYACRQALRQYANTAGTGPLTFLDFSTGSRPFPNLPWP